MWKGIFCIQTCLQNFLSNHFRSYVYLTRGKIKDIICRERDENVGSKSLLYLNAQTTDMKANSLRHKFKCQSQTNIWDVDTGYKGLVFCRNNGWIIENTDKGLTVPKWEPKIPQMPQNDYAQFVCPSPNVLDFNEKRLHWASVVCTLVY